MTDEKNAKKAKKNKTTSLNKDTSEKNSVVLSEFIENKINELAQKIQNITFSQNDKCSFLDIEQHFNKTVNEIIQRYRNEVISRLQK